MHRPGWGFNRISYLCKNKCLVVTLNKKSIIYVKSKNQTAADLTLNLGFHIQWICLRYFGNKYDVKYINTHIIKVEWIIKAIKPSFIMHLNPTLSLSHKLHKQGLLFHYVWLCNWRWKEKACVFFYIFCRCNIYHKVIVCMQNICDSQWKWDLLMCIFFISSFSKFTGKQTLTWTLHIQYLPYIFYNVRRSNLCIFICLLS